MMWFCKLWIITVPLTTRVNLFYEIEIFIFFFYTSKFSYVFLLGQGTSTTRLLLVVDDPRRTRRHRSAWYGVGPIIFVDPKLWLFLVHIRWSWYILFHLKLDNLTFHFKLLPLNKNPAGPTYVSIQFWICSFQKREERPIMCESFCVQFE